MSAVVGLFGLILAACGTAIAAAGIKAAADGRGIGGSILVTIGIVVLYPAYLFARTAWRARKASAADSTARLRQARALRFSVWYVLAGVAVSLFIPVSGLIKVTLIVMFVAAAVVAMAARIDPQRREAKRGHRRS